jgi:hypothetical protein
MMMPFCKSARGGFQEMVAERENIPLAPKFRGLPLGTAKKCHTSEFA